MNFLDIVINDEKFFPENFRKYLNREIINEELFIFVNVLLETNCDFEDNDISLHTWKDVLEKIIELENKFSNIPNLMNLITQKIYNTIINRIPDCQNYKFQYESLNLITPEFMKGGLKPINFTCIILSHPSCVMEWYNHEKSLRNKNPTI